MSDLGQDAPAAGTAPPLLALDGVDVVRGAGRVAAEVSLRVDAGQIVALLGVNGAGKSSLVQAVAGMLPVTAGSIVLAGSPIQHLPPERRARLGLGLAPEGRRVFPGMTVRDNLLAACRADRATRQERVASVYELFPQLAPKDRTHAWQLSGGQQQMLAIGRALMNLPRVLLLDEPTLGLAPAVVADLLERLTWIAGSGTGVLIAEQNSAVLSIAERVAVMRVGRVVLEETGQRLARAPGMLERAMLGA